MRLEIEADVRKEIFYGEMRDENRKARPGYAPFRRRDRR